MSHEELGLSEDDQLDIRERAVLGAFHDAIGEILPTEDEFISEEFKRQMNETIGLIMSDLGVSRNEARLILAEQLLIERNGRRNNGEDI